MCEAARDQRAIVLKAIAPVVVACFLLAAGGAARAAEGGGYTSGGLQGQYFDNTDLAGSPGFTRRDVRLDFGTNNLPPGGAGQAGDAAFQSVPATNFSAQWTGQLIPRFSETYTFETAALDPFLIQLRPSGGSAWTTVISGTNTSGTMALTAGAAYDLQATLAHAGGPWAAQLRWHSPSTPDEVIDPLADAGFNNPDWTAGFTDITRGAGRNTWANLNTNGSVNWGGLQAQDALGWPMGDGAYIFQESLNEGLGVDPLMRGLVTFSFQGKATVSLYGNVVGSSLAYSYNASQNETSGSFLTADHGVNASAFIFSQSSRNGQSSGPAGITDLHLMRPTAPDATSSYTASNSLFTPQMLAAMSRFTVVRHQLVANQQVNWSERTLPAYFNQNQGAISQPHYGIGPASDNGASWEDKVLLANESGSDLMISIPTPASGSTPADTTSYIWNLANLLCHGSDGTNAYTAPTANPVYPPLNPNLRVYLELGNELWNWGNPYYVDYDNITALAAADVVSNDVDFQQFNFDGLSAGTDGSGNYVSMGTWHPRKIIQRMMEISDIFRAVFGDAAMMSRVRPLYEWQYANDNDTAGLALTFADTYFNNGDGQAHVATPHPVGHWLWGGGGATYYGAANGDGLTGLIPDPSFGVPALTNAGYATNPPGSTWTFSGTAGIAVPGANAPQIPPPYAGGQMGFITDEGSISIPVKFPSDFISPIFGLSFKAVNCVEVGATNADQESLRVYLDETNDLTAVTFSQGSGYTIPAAYSSASPWLAVNVSWAASDYYYTRSFTVQPGSTHTITLRGYGNWANPASRNQTAFIGEVRVTSVDAIFAGGLPGGGEAAGQPVGEVYQQTLNTEATWAKAFGLQELSYEGGWSLGGDDGGSWVQNEAKYGDARTAAAQNLAMNMFDDAGSAVSVFGTYEQWPNWTDYYAQQGLLDIDAYPIVQGIEQHGDQLPPEPNNGVPAPAYLAPVTASILQSANAQGQITSAGGWIDWNVIIPQSGNYDITVNSSGTNLAAALLVDDAPVTNGGNLSGIMNLTLGLHSVKVRSISESTYSLQNVIISASGALSPPTGLSASAGNAQATLSWLPVAGATDYQIRFGTTPGIYTASEDAGLATNIAIPDLTNDQEYFFVVLAGNASGLSLPSTEVGGIPLSPGETGSLALWDFDGAVGNETNAFPIAISGSVQMGSLTRGAGLDPSASNWAASLRANRFASEPDGGVGHVYGTNLAAAISLSQYYQFTMRATAGQTLSLAELSFLAYFQNGAGGAGMTYSTNGAAFGGGLLASGTPASSTIPWTVDLSGQPALQNTTNEITFRIYLYGLGPYTVSGLGDPSGPGVVVSGSAASLLPPAIRFATNGGGIWFSNGAVGLLLNGLMGGANVVLETSSNLVQWRPILTNPPASGPLQFIDSSASHASPRFYRAVVP